MPFITLENLQRFHSNLLNFLLGKQNMLVSGDIEITSNGKHNQTNNTTTVGITQVIEYKNI